MQRRKFLSLFTSAAVTSPLAAGAQNSILDEVQDMRRQLGEARQQTMHLLSMISEMRKPLGIILGYTDLILVNACDETPDEVRIALHNIRRGGTHATEMINAVFDRELRRRSADNRK
jgi:signal transduction histidine kinase